MTKHDADIIIIGSGFGGSVTAARLAQAGKKVLVLERGRRWTPEMMPRGPDDAWIFNPQSPEKQNGWLDFRWYGSMSVAMGAGVGGGSLIYGNVSVIPPQERFANGWPQAISYQELLPHYQTVGEVLSVQMMPAAQRPPRYYLMKKAATALGLGDKFMDPPLAITFSDTWPVNPADPYADKESLSFTNQYGRQQGSCNHCGFCCSGCQYLAKNTLDLNYLAIAEDNGATILPLHQVSHIEKLTEGYAVHLIEVSSGEKIAKTFTANYVVVAAGSLGSTEILLRSRDEFKTLPYISPELGKHWSANGDFVTFSLHKKTLLPTRGPTVSAAINVLEGDGYQGAKIFVEDGALGDVPKAYLYEAIWGIKKWSSWRWYIRLLAQLLKRLKKWNTAPHVMAWFAQSVDAGNGQIRMQRAWYAPWRKKMTLKWQVRASEANFNAVSALHKSLAKAAQAERVITLPTWSVLKDLVTPHPLGGCRMADTAQEGVVNHAGEVFGYPKLYVCDGAIIPISLGINPSRTIAALAERNAQLLLHKMSFD